VTEKDWTQDSRYDPRWVAPRYRPKPSAREVYGDSKRFDAAQRRDEEHHGIDFAETGRIIAEMDRRRADEQRAAAEAAQAAEDERRWWADFRQEPPAGD
jgi:hypothetical protein